MEITSLFKSLFASFCLIAAIAANGQSISFVISDEICTGGNGSIDATVTGGQPPYEFDWSNGQTTEDLIWLNAGSYTLTVTDDNLQQWADVAIVGQNNMNLNAEDVMSAGYDGALHWPCPGQCNGRLSVDPNIFGGTPPYNYNLNGPNNPQWLFTTGQGIEVFGGVCGDEVYSLTVSDANGCAGYDPDVYDLSNPPSTVIPVMNITPATDGLANGSADIDVGSDNWIYQTLEIFDSQMNLHSQYLEAEGVVSVSGLSFGNYTARIIYTLTHGPCFDDYPFAIPDTTIGAMAQGVVFNDEDLNCIQDPGDIGIPGLLLRFDPGPEYGITSYDGSYQFVLPYGNYDLTQESTGIEQICPVGSPVNFDLTQNSPIATIDLADTIFSDLDVELLGANGFARPGFVFQQTLFVQNLTADTTGQITLTYLHDMLLSMDSSNVTYTVNANEISWDLGSLGPFQFHVVQAYLTLDVNAPIGTILTNNSSASCAAPEALLANNNFLHHVEVTAAFDPNDKLSVPEGSFILEQDSVIDYTIRFQNTGNDTAFNVVITDTLSPTLDMATLQIGAASHSFEYTLETGRVLKFTFPNILLPDSNVNEPASHGYVGFRIRPIDGLMVGNLITNTANIFFDFNAPVITDPNILMIDGTTGQNQIARNDIIIFPNPTNGRINVQMPGGMIAELEILDISGRKLIQLSPGQNEVVELDLSSFANGIYMVKAVDHYDQKYMAKIQVY